MRVDSAIELINAMIFKTGWRFTATDNTHRFEGSVCVRVEYPAANSDRENAKNGYKQDVLPLARASFALIVRDCDDMSLYRQILDIIAEIDSHEAREFLRVLPTFWAPFHPHNIDGMRQWRATSGRESQIIRDLQFGLA